MYIVGIFYQQKQSTNCAYERYEHLPTLNYHVIPATKNIYIQSDNYLINFYRFKYINIENLNIGFTAYFVSSISVIEDDIKKIYITNRSESILNKFLKLHRGRMCDVIMHTTEGNM